MLVKNKEGVSGIKMHLQAYIICTVPSDLYKAGTFKHSTIQVVETLWHETKTNKAKSEGWLNSNKHSNYAHFGVHNAKHENAS